MKKGKDGEKEFSGLNVFFFVVVCDVFLLVENFGEIIHDQWKLTSFFKPAIYTLLKNT